MSMELTKRLWEQPTDKGVLAYHIIQSFSPGEATPDQVHEIGCEFARRFLADRFECTVSTHLDKGHLHNHIVVNSVSYADGKMFRNNFDTYYHGIRQVSDELCRENRLSVIETDGKGKSYDEWLSGQAGKPTIWQTPVPRQKSKRCKGKRQEARLPTQNRKAKGRSKHRKAIHHAAKW